MQYYTFKAYDQINDRDTVVHISGHLNFENLVVRIVDDLLGNVSIVSQTNTHHSTYPAYIINFRAYYHFDGPFEYCYHAEAILSGEDNNSPIQ